MNEPTSKRYKYREGLRRFLDSSKTANDIVRFVIDSNSCLHQGTGIHWTELAEITGEVTGQPVNWEIINDKTK